MAKKKRSLREKEMFRLISQCSESGLTNKEFCRRNKLCPQTFYYWKKKFQKKKHEPVPGNFIPVELPSRAEHGSEIELRYPNGVQIKVNASAGAGFIRQLVNLV